MKSKNGLILFIVIAVTALLGALAYLGLGEEGKLGYKGIPLGLDLAGGVQITYQAGIDNPTDEEMASAISVIQRRLDVNNYTEAEAYKVGKNRIYVEIPGVKDPSKAVADIGKTAQLEFIGIDTTKLPAGSNTLFGQSLLDAASKVLGATELVITGADVKSAAVGTQNSQNSLTSGYIVKLDLKSEAAKKFAAGTQKFLNKPIAIVLDGNAISTPRVSSIISDGTAMINGMSSLEEARTLANLINSGALPFDLKPIESNGVGAKLGSEAIESSILAGAIGFGLVLIFMLCFYRLPGVAADIALIFYAAILIVALSAFKLTLTLPGVAGIILSIGMAVDANVVIFSRIKEELYLNKGVGASIDSGFKKALSAIIDGNVTTLIAAVVLYFLGSGPIKGFAQTLGLGIIISMFTALVITRIIIKAFYELGIRNKGLYGISLKKLNSANGER